MRDPFRIDKILKELEIYWKKYPDLRFGQLACVATATKSHTDPFFVEDDKVLDNLKRINNYG